MPLTMSFLWIEGNLHSGADMSYMYIVPQFLLPSDTIAAFMHHQFLMLEAAMCIFGLT